MSIQATIRWERGLEDRFQEGIYSRKHEWVFDGGARLWASSAPDIVHIPMSDPSLIDPEEALLASIASCHMLFFLSIAGRKRYSIHSYEDHPTATLGKLEGKNALVTAQLRPVVIFDTSKKPTTTEVATMHNLAHQNCFIANSLKTKITII